MSHSRNLHILQHFIVIVVNLSVVGVILATILFNLIFLKLQLMKSCCFEHFLIILELDFKYFFRHNKTLYRI